jgi:ATP-binding cassette subfamily E protein 1
VLKPQSINITGRKIKGNIEDHLTIAMASDLNLQHIMERSISNLSGGELQRFLIGLTLKQNKDLYMLDEPSCFLDIKERLNLAKMIDKLEKTLIIIEHDIALLDYVSDIVSIVYGSPGSYGVVSNTYSPKNCLNYFIDGYLPSENMRFRQNKLSMRPVRDCELISGDRNILVSYDSHQVLRGSFTLDVSAGRLNMSSILLILGENGTGKTTFINDLVARQEKDINISYKPQTLTQINDTTVINYLLSSLGNRLYVAEVSRLYTDFTIESIKNRFVEDLSGGELQRLLIFETLSRDADLYLLDEPSAYLDIEQRISITAIIRRFILQFHKSCVVIEHDFIMGIGLADEIIYMNGDPGIHCSMSPIKSVKEGINEFLCKLNITVRSDNGRFRFNKLDSQKDLFQKQENNYLETGP